MGARNGSAEWRADLESGSGSVTFRVGLRLGPVKGGGKLTVERGAIVLETDRLTRSLSRVSRIVHTDRQVMLVKARLVPPWFNTSLALHDDEASGYAVTWLGARNRLRDSLTAAGFDVQEVTTWVSLAGSHLGSLQARRRGLTGVGGRSRVGFVAAIVGAAAIAVLVVGDSLFFVALALVCVALSIVPLFRS